MPHVDRVGIQERVDALAKRSIKGEAKREGLLLAISMLDLTTLEGADTPGKVRQLAAKAVTPSPAYPEVPVVRRGLCLPDAGAAPRAMRSRAPACTWRRSRPGSRPGRRRWPRAWRRRALAVADGADEIDMVISRDAYLSGDDARVADEIEQIKDACGDAYLKVILETVELGSYDHVRHASMLAMDAGADFIKTSTGKAAEGATPGVILVMLEAIRDYAQRTGRVVGMKPAGGVSTSKAALQRARPGQGDPGRRVADARPAAHRRLVGAQRPAGAVHQDGDRPLRAVGGLLEGVIA